MTLDGIKKWREWIPTPTAIGRMLTAIGARSAATPTARVATAALVLGALLLLLAHACRP